MKFKYLIAVTALILFGTVFQSLTMFRSGQKYEYGIGYWGPTARDGVWHQALVESLKKQVPPENPGLSGTVLANYHYYYDLLVAKTGVITKIASLDLIYRIYPIVFSILFGIETFILSGILFKSRIANLFSLFFVYFGSSFGWIIEFIRERHFGGESAFWMNQPVSMNLNPPFAISMVMMIGITILYLKYRENKTWKITIPLILLSGLLIEFKVYAGVIVLGALSVVSIKSIITNKDYSYLKICIPSIIISSLLFLPQIKMGGGFFEYKPFWFIHSMIDSPDRVGWLKLASARANYQLSGNWPKFILSEILALFIFVVGNMGTRIIAFASVLKISGNKIMYFEKYDFILWIIIISITIPLFLVQKGNPWNTIQFGYYFLYFTALFAGYSLSRLLKMKNKIIAYFICFVVILVTPISSYTTFTFAYTDAPPAKLTSEEYQALEYLRSLESGAVLTPMYDKDLRSRYINPFPLAVYDTTAYVSAFSGKAVFLEDEGQQQILGSDYLDRKTEIQKFFLNSDLVWKEDFLKENNIKYIYLPKLYSIGLSGVEKITEIIYENNEVIVYKYIK